MLPVPHLVVSYPMMTVQKLLRTASKHCTRGATGHRLAASQPASIATRRATKTQHTTCAA